MPRSLADGLDGSIAAQKSSVPKVPGHSQSVDGQGNGHQSGPRGLSSVTDDDCNTLELGVEWHDDRPVTVPIVNFNFDSIDHLEDHAREALAAGRLGEWLNRLIEAQRTEVRIETIDFVIGDLLDAAKPKLQVVYMGFAVGSMPVFRMTMEEWGKRFGVSKQDVEQGIDAVRKKYKLRQNRTSRSAEAKERMRENNFRPNGDSPA